MEGREGWIDSTELGFLCLLITLVLEMLLVGGFVACWMIVEFSFFYWVKWLFPILKAFLSNNWYKNSHKVQLIWAIEKDLLITIHTNHTNNKKLPNRTFKKGCLLTCVCSSSATAAACGLEPLMDPATSPSIPPLSQTSEQLYKRIQSFLNERDWL